MSWNFVNLHDVAPTSWCNGGGVTRELAVEPHDEDWRWRISVAEVTSDGQFSTFDGISRWLAVLSGAGFELDIKHVDETEVDSTLLQVRAGHAAVAFDGSARTYCRLLSGPTRDLNLMVRGAKDQAHLERFFGSRKCRVIADHVIGIFAIGSALEVTFDGTTTKLPSDTLVWRRVTHPVDASVIGPHGLWMEIAT